MRFLCILVLLLLPALVYSDPSPETKDSVTELCGLSAETKAYLAVVIQKKQNLCSQSNCGNDVDEESLLQSVNINQFLKSLDKDLIEQCQNHQKSVLNNTKRLFDEYKDVYTSQHSNITENISLWMSFLGIATAVMGIGFPIIMGLSFNSKLSEMKSKTNEMESDITLKEVTLESRVKKLKRTTKKEFDEHVDALGIKSKSTADRFVKEAEWNLKSAKEGAIADFKKHIGDIQADFDVKSAEFMLQAGAGLTAAKETTLLELKQRIEELTRSAQMNLAELEQKLRRIDHSISERKSQIETLKIDSSQKSFKNRLLKPLYRFNKRKETQKVKKLRYPKYYFRKEGPLKGR